MPENVEKVRRQPSLPSRSPLKPALARKRPKRLRQGRSPLGRAHVLLCTLRRPNGRALRDAASNTYGLVGRAFLNIPQLLCVED